MKKLMAVFLTAFMIVSCIPAEILAVDAGSLTAPVQVTSLPSKENFHIYLCIGQSNMAGRGPISDNEMVRMENVYLLNGDDTWEYAQPWYDEAYTGVDSNRDENGIIWGGYNRYSTVR